MRAYVGDTCQQGRYEVEAITEDGHYIVYDAKLREYDEWDKFTPERGPGLFADPEY